MAIAPGEVLRRSGLGALLVTFASLVGCDASAREEAPARQEAAPRGEPAGDPAPAQQDALAGFIDEYARTHEFHGTIAVQQRGALLHRRSYGLANRPFAVPHGDDTKYKVASITKLFTAALVLQLRDRGKLDLDATIHTYLPSYAGEAATKVTVHQLLNHTSGMQNADEGADPAKGVPHYQTPMSSDELVRRFYSGPLAAEPGRKFDYNNADYVLLGKIVEAIHQKPRDRSGCERRGCCVRRRWSSGWPIRTSPATIRSR
ncbi:serine hydrolase domain-containing protein [Nannocystis sp. RBIL2]|uniref:serine hydrolase domain-containing protein n=1 Tax=unclassified Nannocystis TaxID=2627009 RepID=UPI003209E365